MDFKELQLISLKNQVDQNTTSLGDIAKKTSPTKIKIYSESILGAGNFPAQLATATGATVTEAWYGGSEIGSSLAEQAEEVYTPCVSENSVKMSNKLTDIAFNQSIVTITKETLPDGLDWFKVVKPDSTAYIGLQTDSVLPCPAAATGCVVAFDMYIPSGTTPSPMQTFRIWLKDNIAATEYSFNWNTALTSGKKYRVVAVVDKADLPIAAGTGNSIRLAIHMNRWSSHVACTAYFRNLSVVWNSIGVCENYMPTLSSYVTAGSPTWKKINKSKFESDYECILISFGRNEADANVSPKAHYLAYDKLIYDCSRKSGQVIITNPPPRYDAINHVWHSNDQYVDYGYVPYFQKLMKKWNSGIDVNTEFRVNQTAQTVMADEYHQNDAGSAIIVNKVLGELNTRKIMNGALSELSLKSRLYLTGMPTGTWKKTPASSSFFSRTLNDLFDYAIQSTTQNSYLLFENIECQQLWAVYKISNGYGTITAIIDEGTGNEQQITLDTNGGASVYDRTHGHFLCDFGEVGTHTVKLVVTSSGTTVRIHGIVAI